MTEKKRGMLYFCGLQTPLLEIRATVFINQVNVKTGKAADIFTAMYLINMTSNGVYNNNQ